MSTHLTTNTVIETSSINEKETSDSSEPGGLLSLQNCLLNIQRLPEHFEKYNEIKDPSVVVLKDGTHMMYASIGNSFTQQWIVGRFVSTHPSGPWQEISPVVFKEISGPQLCAPAVTYEVENGQEVWKMYIQTACFEENGVIALAISYDGETFIGQSQALASRETIQPEHQSSVIGVYDAGVSEVKIGQEEMLCMLFSGYRRVGCGDLYASYRKKSSAESEWSPAQRLLAQEEVPFHNHPEYEHFEWGLEGAKLIQLSEKCFLLIGVCFLPKPKEFLGTRQRVFFAVAENINGPFMPVCTPFTPFENEGRAGENGHPDTLMTENNDLWVIYQERYGDGYPWHLRSARYDLFQLREYFEEQLKVKKNQKLEITSKEKASNIQTSVQFAQQYQT